MAIRNYIVNSVEILNERDVKSFIQIGTNWASQVSQLINCLDQITKVERAGYIFCIGSLW